MNTTKFLITLFFAFSTFVIKAQTYPILIPGENNFIDDDNQVIGLDNPSYGLNGNAMLRIGSKIDQPYVNIEKWGKDLVNTSPVDQINGHFQYDLKKTIFRIDENGKVGIGTASPTQLLDVKGNLVIGNNNWTSLELDGTGENDWMLNAHNDEQSLHFRGKRTNSTSYDYFFTIKRDDKRIGVNNPNPDATIHANNNDDTFLYLENTNASYGSLVKLGAVSHNNRKECQLQFEERFALYDHDAGKWRFQIDNTGRVIIGDKKITAGSHNTSDVKLTVDGHAIFKKVIVTQSNWADFVFAEDYKLKPLAEVENFITQNKHLPDVPSENEVIENGISLGDMDAILLQKVEELTLYMIDLEKQNQQLSKEIKQLKKTK